MRTDTQNVRTEGQVNNNNAPHTDREGLQEAIDKFRKAVAARKVDPICAAYEALRKAAEPMAGKEVLDLLTRTVGRPASEMVVSAYSHRDCFMCTSGTVPCTQCEGTGQIEEGRFCPPCDGLGLVECPFCFGTSWADRATVPKELQNAVLDRQWVHVQHDLERVEKAFAGATAETVRRFDPANRRNLISWLLRLEARLADLNEAGLNPGGDPGRLAVETRRVESYLNMMKTHRTA